MKCEYLIKNAINDLKEAIRLNKVEFDDNDIYDSDDTISKIAEDNNPNNNTDLLYCAIDNNDLLDYNDSCGKYPNVIQIISNNIYDILIDEMYKYISERK